MVTDFGLHLYRGNLEGLDGMEPDDLEVRKRLYLSAFMWDKCVKYTRRDGNLLIISQRSISLCLGRPPSLTELPYSPDSLCKSSLAYLEVLPH